MQAKMINIRSEVQALLGRQMTANELRKFLDMRQFGFANPYDIVAQLGRKW